MKGLVFILTFFCLLARASSLYESENFILHLDDEQQFMLYPKEQSLKFNYTGNYVYHQDSLILTTHQENGESAILAIYHSGRLQMQNIYTHKFSQEILPSTFYLARKCYPNGIIAKEWRWDNYSTQSFTVYSFSPEKWIQAITPYQNGLKNGKELIFFDNAYGVIQQELHFEDGVLHGKVYEYEAIAGDFLQVALVLTVKYKKGNQVRIKKPATPPIFYTSHF